jgi:hypothetical protein
MVKQKYFNIILYKKILLNLNKFINISNNMLFNKVLHFSYSLFPLLHSFIKKLLYLGFISGYKIDNKRIIVFFSYNKLGINSFTKFLFISTYNDIKYVNDFFLKQLNSNSKMNFNKIHLFLFNSNFYTLFELNALLKNKKLNNKKILYVCKIHI